MSRRLPPLQWLRAFEAAARLESFTAAAQELGLTQAAVSQQVRSLETRLGRPLFRRLAHGLKATEAALAYLPTVQRALDLLAEGTAEVFGGDRAAVRVRATPGFALLWLVPRLPAFRAREPDIALNLSLATWPEAADEPQVELEVRPGFGDWPGLTSHRLTWERAMPLCAPAYAQRLALAGPRDLSRARLLHAVGFAVGWPQWLAAAGCGAEVTIEAGAGDQFDSLLPALSLAAAGEGVVLGRSALAQPYLDRDELISPLGPALEIEEAFYLLHRGVTPQSAAAKRFLEWLLEEAAGAGWPGIA